ncbi:PPE family protein [Mycobacterium interjectum]|uniref:PPE family protein n=1 Tax=Mycobacterium interjectum TaxID=33895 RepID=UPI0008367912|nr:PPE family protein [Mycobacterium interjectum]MCV7089059.1 PPE family protein [Mycobacterium interjectum]
MDFGLLPPEVNSTRMYTGPGSGPMLAAAAAWDDLAAQLHSTAASYSSVISGLTVDWRGPASATMAAAAAPYTSWISATAGQAEEAATQARVAALAFETAYATTVPPAVVAANRARLMALVATNLLGQNTPAIMETQSEYIEMWAQDVAAMYGYAGSSATASQVTPFNPPPRTTNPAGSAGQAAAIAQAVGGAAGQTQTLPQLMSAVPSSLQSLAAPASSAAPAAAADPSAPASLASSVNTIISSITGPSSPLSLFTIPGVPYLLGVQSYLLPQNAVNIANAASKAAAASASSAGLANVGSETGGLGSTVSAGVGRAGLVGGLSVPQGWTTAAPAVKPVAAVLMDSGPGGGPAAVAAQGEGPLFSNMALSSLAGRAMVGTGGAAPRSAGTAGGAVAAGEAGGAVNIFLVPTGAQ